MIFKTLIFLNKMISDITGNIDVDLKILSLFNDKELIFLRLTNKYVNSLCLKIWTEKILVLYPNLPIPTNISSLRFYYKIKDSYTDIKKYALFLKNEDILNWLTIPKNDINIILEMICHRCKYAIDWYESRTIFANVLNYLANNIYPLQRTVNMLVIDTVTMTDSGKSLYIEILDLLCGYNIFPTQEYINYATEKFYYDIVRLFGRHGKFPVQISIDYTYQHSLFVNCLHNSAIETSILLKLCNKIPDTNIDYDDYRFTLILEKILKNTGRDFIQGKINHLYNNTKNLEHIRMLCKYKEFPSKGTINYPYLDKNDIIKIIEDHK